MRIVDYAQIVLIDPNKFIMQIFNAPQLMWILFFFKKIYCYLMQLLQSRASCSLRAMTRLLKIVTVI